MNTTGCAPCFRERYSEPHPRHRPSEIGIAMLIFRVQAIGLRRSSNTINSVVLFSTCLTTFKLHKETDGNCNVISAFPRTNGVRRCNGLDPESGITDVSRPQGSG